MLRAWLVLACLCPAFSLIGAPAAKQPAPTKPKPETPVIVGIPIERPNQEFLGLAVVDNHFSLSFYNAKKKKIPANVQRATLRWPVKYQPNDERTVLNVSADGMTLASGMTVRPPRKFKVFMSLFVEGSEAAVETYNIDFHE